MKGPVPAWVALCAVLGVSTAHAQDSGTPSSGAERDPAMQMQEWMKYTQPGEPHRELGFYAGDWTFVNHATMGGQESTSEGTAHVELMMGGRYVHAVHQSEMWGMPFEGAGITGYDNVRKEYFNVWFDNMGTGIMVSRGQKNEKGEIEVRGTYPDPRMGDVSYRMISRITGEDTYTYEMYMDLPEGEERVMEILYTRVTK